MITNRLSGIYLGARKFVFYSVIKLISEFDDFIDAIVRIVGSEFVTNGFIILSSALCLVALIDGYPIEFSLLVVVQTLISFL